jgi:hypothetical protein
MRICPVGWGSHACDLPSGHEGDHLCLADPVVRLDDDPWRGPGHICLYSLCCCEPVGSPRLFVFSPRPDDAPPGVREL